MNKENILDLLILLSAIESWSFANKNDLPGYLQETLDENIKRLRLALLNETTLKTESETEREKYRIGGGCQPF